METGFNINRKPNKSTDVRTNSYLFKNVAGLCPVCHKRIVIRDSKFYSVDTPISGLSRFFKYVPAREHTGSSKYLKSKVSNLLEYTNRSANLTPTRKFIKSPEFSISKLN